ncbi:glycosyltransferase family 2 protein [Astrobacterium formosum]|uniref:glycosyltransferase family 2 protein n=1 Tax=Astrobacterium formosum TaxID=3069710 RepID=UPI003F509018
MATLGGDAELELLLASLEQCKPPPNFEVIIVDQNDGDQLAATIARHAETLALRYEHVAFRGACRARNHGARLARGQWLGFPDDDCQFSPDGLARIASITGDPRIGVVTGRTVDEEGRPNVLQWGPTQRRFSRWSMFGCLTETTLFVDRDLFAAAGGFDEDFGPGGRWPAAEGIDLMDRLFAVLGDREARYDPAIELRHPTKIPPWNRWAARRFYEYAQGDGALIAKRFSLHMLYWGCRTLLAGVRNALTTEKWQSAAYLLRIAGLFKGFVTYSLRRRAPECAA